MLTRHSTYSVLFFLVALFVPSLAFAASGDVHYDITAEERAAVEASTQGMRFYEKVWEQDATTVNVKASDFFRAGRLFFLVDEAAGETKNEFRVIGIVQLTRSTDNLNLNDKVALSILRLACANIVACVSDKDNLVVTTAKSLAMRSDYRKAMSGGGAVLSAQLWWAMMHGAVKDDLLNGFFYGVSAAGRYKRLSLGGDFVFNVLDRNLVKATGLKGKKKELSLLLVGFLKGQLSENWFLQSSGTWGKLANDNGQSSKMYFGDMLAVYHWTDFVMAGFGYRYTQVDLPADPERTRRTYRQHMLFTGFWNPQIIGYSEPGLSWMWDAQFGFGATDYGAIAIFADARAGALYTYKFFRVKLGYRGLIDSVLRKQNETVNGEKKSGVEFYLVTHGPYLELSFVL